MPAADPKKLGKYEIVAKIGQGAMGTVHRAHDPVLNRDVAIKTMIAGDSDSELRKRFEREAQSAARLNHPNIITVYDFGEEKGRMYIAMELLDGADLKEVINRQRPLSLDAKLDLMEQICEGLAFAHAREVIHRDLKPANIHLLPNGQVKIMDFGLARITSASELTGAGMMLGTPNYMSPEQVRGQKASTRSDVFSLGVVFYELLSGRKAFDAELMAGVLFQVMQKDPEPLESIRGELGPVSTVIHRALAKDPAARYADARELREALREARRLVRTDAIRSRSPQPGGTVRESPSGAGTLVRPAADGTLTTVPRAPRPADETREVSATPVPAVTQRPSDTARALRDDPPTIAEMVDDGTLAAAPPSLTVALPLDPTPARPEPPPRAESSRPVPPSRPGSLPRLGARDLPSPRPGVSTKAVVLGAAGLGLVGVVVLWLAVRPGPTPPTAAETTGGEPTPASPTPPAASPTSAAPSPDPRLLDAQRHLRARDYRAALASLEGLDAGDPTEAEAARPLAEEARRALKAADETAARLERALAAKDAAQASQALSTLLAEDPRRPDLAALAQRLNDLLKQPPRAEPGRPTPLPATPRPTPTPAAVTPATTLAHSPVAPPSSTLLPTPLPATTLPAPPAAPALQSETAARQAIRGVLDEYRAAFERRDADALRAVQPGIDYDAMKKTFASVTGYTVRIDVKEVTVKGAEGRASCVVTYQPQPKPAQKIPPQNTVFHLRRSGDVWLIERLERR